MTPRSDFSLLFSHNVRTETSSLTLNRDTRRLVVRNGFYTFCLTVIKLTATAAGKCRPLTTSPSVMFHTWRRRFSCTSCLLACRYNCFWTRDLVCGQYGHSCGLYGLWPRCPVNSSHGQLVTYAELTVFLCRVNRCFLDTLWRVDRFETVNSSHGKVCRVDRKKTPPPTFQISFEVQFECCVMWEQAYVSRSGWERVWQRISLYFIIKTDNLSQWLQI